MINQVKRVLEEHFADFSLRLIERANAEGYSFRQEVSYALFTKDHFYDMRGEGSLVAQKRGGASLVTQCHPEHVNVGWGGLDN